MTEAESNVVSVARQVDGAHGDELPGTIVASFGNDEALRQLNFYDLPFIARERIYRYALVPGKIFVRPFISLKYLDDRDSDGGYLSAYIPPNLALLRTSTSIHAEACFTFYRENIFSFVQPDLLVCLLEEQPHRMRALLKHMHKIEIVFDYRDYQYLTEDLCRGLEASAAALTARTRTGAAAAPAAAAGLSPSSTASTSSSRTLHESADATAGTDAVDGADPPSAGGPSSPDDLSAAADSLLRLRAYIRGAHLRRSKADLPSDAWTAARHAHNIAVLRTYLWGRTLTFVAQTLLVTDLHLDFRNCFCPGRCCRLAADVLGWGWSRWVYGLPRNVHISNATEAERMAVLECIRRLEGGKRDEQADSVPEPARELGQLKSSWTPPSSAPVRRSLL
ncbi:hypothetical protein KEM52_000637 [Ascosphaera acerosa]|nr:hypothetical protein KEM52_000637 [Ascosphaera acerosa]